MAKKTYTGINIQWPISELILSGEKTVETRTYGIPEKYLNEPMVLIETPGKQGKFKARIVAVIKFTNCFKYTSKTAFYKDVDRHKVEKGSMWAWDPEKPKWGWEVEIIKTFKPKAAPSKKGIVFTKGIEL